MRVEKMLTIDSKIAFCFIDMAENAAIAASGIKNSRVNKTIVLINRTNKKQVSRM